MKIFSLLALLVMSGVASANTLALDTVVCGNAISGNCVVYDNGTALLRLYWNAYGAVQVATYTRDANGVLSAGPVYTANVGANPTKGLNGVALADPVGHVVTLSGTFLVERVLIHSGHNYYGWRTTFQGGTIIT